MTDVNEEIVAKYFELKGYLVHKNLKYMVHKKSSGESDIDLAVFNIQTRDKAIIEVKGWHTETFSKGYFTSSEKEGYRSRLFHFIRLEAIQKATEFFGTNDFRKILVIPELSKKDRAMLIQTIKAEKDVEILEFKEILPFIIEKTEENKNYRDSEFLQTIRLLKTYKLLK
jgi:hypothetical protein